MRTSSAEQAKLNHKWGLVKLRLELAGLKLSSVSADDRSQTSLPVLDVCVTSEDKRYFVSETDDISNLETSILENPQDTQLWIKLAFKYLSQPETYVCEQPAGLRSAGLGL